MLPGEGIAGVRGELYQREEKRNHRVIGDGAPALVDDILSFAFGSQEIDDPPAALVGADQDADGKPPVQRIDLSE